MSYTHDSLLAKLASLIETQESIVSTAQWIIFHRRHADTTAQLWLQRLKESSNSKQLYLMYLVNEVVQQSKARKKDEFLHAFTPLVVDACAVAYRGATNDIQHKLKRVIEVWRDRQIFDESVQQAIEERVREIDKTKATSNGGLRAGGSIFSSASSSVPKELEPLVAPQKALTKLVLSTKTPVNNANQEWAKHADPNAVIPTPPVYAARLNGLLKNLANAENAVAESIQARKTLIDGLEKFLNVNRATLAEDEKQLAELTSRKNEIDQKKQDVEDSIMRGLPGMSPVTPAGGPDGSPGNSISQTPSTPAPEPERPKVEELTPPPFHHSPRSPDDHDFYVPPKHEEAPVAPLPTPVQTQPEAQGPSGDHSYRQAQLSGTGSLKRRRVEEMEERPGLGEGDAMDDLDPDVAEMLRRDSAPGPAPGSAAGS